MANPFDVMPAGEGVGAGLAGIGTILRANREKQEEETKLQQAEERKRNMMGAVFDAYQSRNPSNWEAVVDEYPEAAELAMQGLGATQDWQRKEMADAALRVLSSPQTAIPDLERRITLGTAQGRDMSDSQELLDMLKAGDVEGANNLAKMTLISADRDMWDAYKESSGRSEVPAAMQTLQMRADAAGLVEGTPEYQEFMRTGGNRSGLASAVTRTYDNGTVLQTLPDGSTKVLGPDGNELTGEDRVQALRKAREEQVEWAAARAGATSRAEGEEKRIQNTIDEGLDAAQGVSTLYRALDLLDSVDTGGFDAAAIKAKQWLGIESADEGELSSSLGKAVLSQLRSTFGAAFTEREGARLEGIEARMGANTATNKRLLQQTLSIVERAANRAIDAAYEIGDTRTARDIEDLLDFRLTDTGGESLSGPPEGVTQEEWDLMTPEEKALF